MRLIHLAFFLNLISWNGTTLFAQQLSHSIYGQHEDNIIGFQLATNEDGSRFAYSSREHINDSSYYEIVTVLDNINGALIPVGNPINCSIYFEDTLVKRKIKFDMSDNSEVLVIVADSVYFSYQFEKNNWILKDKISFELAEKDFVNNFALSGDGNTLCIKKSSNIIFDYGYELFTYERINDKWIKSSLENAENVDAHGIKLSDDGNFLAVVEIESFADNLLHQRVKIYKKTSSEWLLKGNELILFGSFLYTFPKFLLNVEFCKDQDKILLSGIGEAFDYTQNNVHVQMYQFENNLWEPKGQVVNGYHPRDGFGYSTNFSYDGNRFAISSIGIDFDDYLYNGIVKVYDYIEPEWVVLKDTIVGENKIDICGYSTALSGDGNKLYVSCPYSDDPFEFAGHINIYDLSPYTYTKQIPNQINVLDLSPNPTSGLIKIKSVEGEKVRIYNQLGIEVLNIEIVNKFEDIEIDLSQLNNGFYFIHIDNYEVQKVVLVK